MIAILIGVVLAVIVYLLVLYATASTILALVAALIVLVCALGIWRSEGRRNKDLL